MYLQLYINEYLKGQWFFEDVRGDLVDRMTTEGREQEWKRMEQTCLAEAAKTIPNLMECNELQLVWHIRSRIQPRDIPWEEYNAFTEQVTNIQVGRVVGKNKPKLINNKLK